MVHLPGKSQPRDLEIKANCDYESEKFLGTTQGTTLGGNSRPADQGKNAKAVSTSITSGIDSDSE